MLIHDDCLQREYLKKNLELTGDRANRLAARLDQIKGLA